MDISLRYLVVERWDAAKPLLVVRRIYQYAPKPVHHIDRKRFGGALLAVTLPPSVIAAIVGPIVRDEASM